MSQDEVTVFAVCVVASLLTWPFWLAGAMQPRPRTGVRPPRGPLAAALALAVLGLWAVLHFWSSWDVRASGIYTTFYLVMGAAWLGSSVRLMPLWGLTVRDDVAERGNRAAAWAAAGAILGMTAGFAGANIGNGPGWWVVVFCAMLSTGGTMLLWWALARTTRLADSVSIDRDLASGLRAGAFLASVGLILGRSVAGDWHSANGAVRDLAVGGWPALVLLALAVCVELMVRPSPRRPRGDVTSAGLLPAAAYLLAAMGYLAWLGPWETSG